MANKKSLFNSTPVNFTVNFTASSDIAVYTKYTVIDPLPLGLKYKAGDGNTVTADGTPISTATFSVNTVANVDTVTVEIPNDASTAGKEIVVTIATTLEDRTAVPVNLELANTASVKVNDVDGLTTPSNTAIAEFDDFQTVIMDNEVINNRVENAIVNSIVNFTGSFTAPVYTDLYNLVIEMEIPVGTSLDITNSSLKVGTNDVASPVWNTVGGKAQVTFPNAALIQGQKVDAIVATKIDNVATLPDKFNNKFELAIADNTATESTVTTTNFLKALVTVVKAVL